MRGVTLSPQKAAWPSCPAPRPSRPPPALPSTRPSPSARAFLAPRTAGLHQKVLEAQDACATGALWVECASRAWEPGCRCGQETGLTFWSWPPGATRSTPPPAQERLPAGAARGGPVRGGGLERGARRREQAGGVRVQSARLGAPTAPSRRALCPGSPRRGQRMRQASLTGSPVRVPGSQGAALALGVPLRRGGVQALDKRERAQAPSSCPGGRAQGPQPPPLPPQGPQPGLASTPLSKPEPQRAAQCTLRPSGGAGPPLGLGLPRRPHRKWRR